MADCTCWTGGCTGQCAKQACAYGQCQSSCTGSCGGACKGCGGGCDSGCSGGCNSGCAQNCTGSCGTGCERNCTGTCKTECVGCSGSCKGSCIGKCTKSCYGACNYGCTDTLQSRVYRKLKLNEFFQESNIETIDDFIYNQVSRVLGSSSGLTTIDFVQKEHIDDSQINSLVANLNKGLSKINKPTISTTASQNSIASKTFGQAIIDGAKLVYEYVIPRA